MSKAQWHRLSVGILPDDGVEIDEAMKLRLEFAVGAALGPWSMTFGMTVEPIDAPSSTVLPPIDDL